MKRLGTTLTFTKGGKLPFERLHPLAPLGPPWPPLAPFGSGLVKIGLRLCDMSKVQRPMPTEAHEKLLTSGSSSDYNAQPDPIGEHVGTPVPPPGPTVAPSGKQRIIHHTGDTGLRASTASPGFFQLRCRIKDAAASTTEYHFLFDKDSHHLRYGRLPNMRAIASAR